MSDMAWIPRDYSLRPEDYVPPSDRLLAPPPYDLPAHDGYEVRFATPHDAGIRLHCHHVLRYGDEYLTHRATGESVCCECFEEENQGD